MIHQKKVTVQLALLSGPLIRTRFGHAGGSSKVGKWAMNPRQTVRFTARSGQLQASITISWYSQWNHAARPVNDCTASRTRLVSCHPVDASRTRLYLDRTTLSNMALLPNPGRAFPPVNVLAAVRRSFLVKRSVPLLQIPAHFPKLHVPGIGAVVTRLHPV